MKMLKVKDLLVFLIVMVGMHACQSSQNNDATDENPKDSLVEKDATVEKETGKETLANSSTIETQEAEVKTVVARYTSGELHPNTGYSLGFTDKNGNEYFFFPSNETYDGLNEKLIDDKTFQMNQNFERFDYEIKYTEAEGINEFTGDKETQYHIISLEEANTDWNEKIRMLCGMMWTLSAVEKDGKAEPLNESFQIWFHRWTADLYSDDGEEENRWTISDDLKTLTMLGDKKEEYKVEKMTDTELQLSRGKQKLFLIREAENGD